MFCGTGLSAKARGLQRSRISWWTGKSLGAGFCMNSIPSVCGLPLDDSRGVGGTFATPFLSRIVRETVWSVTGFRRDLLEHYHIDGDIDIVIDYDTATVEVGIPLYAEVLAVAPGWRVEGWSGIAPGISTRTNRAINDEDNFLGDAMNRKVTRDFDLAWRYLLELL